MADIEDPLAEPLMGAHGEDPFLSLKNGGTEVYLIRHGDALPGVEEVIPGDYDAQGLSELGRKQAAALAEHLRNLPLTAVYSSPILRAIRTAEPIAQTHNLAVRIEQELYEVRLGPVGPSSDGNLSPEEQSKVLQERLRQIAVVALASGYWSSIPGSEPSAELRARITAAVNTLAMRHPGERIAIVSHGGAINAYFAAMLGIARDYFFPAANTSVSVVRIKGDQRLLLSLNDVSHLAAADLMKLS